MEKDENKEELTDYLREEMAYARDMVNKRWIKKLKHEYQSSKPKRMVIPETYGEYEYWTATHGNNQILKRRKVGQKQTEVLLDAEKLYLEMGLSGMWQSMMKENCAHRDP